MKLSIAILIICTAQAAMASKKGLRGLETDCGQDLFYTMENNDCLVGKEYAFFNFQDCEWQCKPDLSYPAMRAAALQPRQAAPSSPPQRKGGKGGNGGSPCQADFVQTPMVPCPAGYSVMFNHNEDCEWQCKLLPETEVPVESHWPTCLPEQVLFFDIFDGTFECISTEDTQCSDGEHLVFDQEQDFFYCGEI